jgi:A/G-specific adenine glycosylase
MMELGATVCIPFQPRCAQCPIESFCEAHTLGIQNKIPVVRAKPAIKHIRAVILVLERRGRILLTSLYKPHFIPGKWGFPSQQVLKSVSAEEAAFRLSRKILGRTISLAPAPKISHSITRYRIMAYGFLGKLDGPDLQKQATSDFRWVHSRQYGRFLTSSLFRKVLQQFPQLSSRSRSE